MLHYVLFCVVYNLRSNDLLLNYNHKLYYFELCALEEKKMYNKWKKIEKYNEYRNKEINKHLFAIKQKLKEINTE